MDAKLQDKQTTEDASREDLATRCQRAEQDLTTTKRELAEVRQRTSAIVAAAEDRLAWMDRYYLGPETFERRRYMRVLVRGLAFTRRVAGFLRRLPRAS